MPGDETTEVEVNEGTEQAAPEEPNPAESAAEEPVAAEPEPTPEQLQIRALEDSLAAERQRRADTEGRLRAVSKAYTDLQGEMEEFKKRIEARSALQTQSKAAEVVGAFFEPIQNLKRAADAGGDAATLQQGLEMVAKQFHDTMMRLGLTEVPGIGAPFDPNVHEALALAPVEDPAQDGRILMVHRAGYQLGGHVIQPAQVVIGKHEAPAAEA